MRAISLGLDWPHVHIMINHFPVILTVMGAAAAVFGLFRGRRGVWLYATATMTMAALTAIPTYFTGEPAEEGLHRPWYIARQSIHTHEDAALVAAIITGVAGLIALVAWRRLVRYPREISLPGGLRTAVVVTSVIAAAAMGYASLLGGHIIHDAPGLKGPAPAGTLQAPAPAAATPGAGAGAAAAAPAGTTPASTP